MRRLPAPNTTWRTRSLATGAAILATAGCLCSTPHIARAGGVPVSISLDDPRLDTGTGHPRLTGPLDGRVLTDIVGPIDPDPDGGGTPPIIFPVLSPLATGPFVNFESPMVKPLALSGDGRLLFVANTPNNSVTVLNTMFGSDNALLRAVEEIPVGLEPVTVVIRPNSRQLWSVNYVSDDISIISVGPNRVVGVIDVGDKPSNLLFSPEGDLAYVVTEGQAKGASLEHKPYLSTIDCATRTVIHTLELPVHKPRGMVLHAPSQRLLITPVHSGNDTTSVGVPIRRQFGGTSDIVSAVEVLRDFSVTAATFASFPELAPYPDTSVVPNPPRVHRVVTDAGQNGPWQQLLALIADGAGNLLPGIAAQYDAEFGTINGADVLQLVVDNAPDTLNNDLIEIDLSTPAAPSIAAVVDGIGTTLTGMGIHPTQRHVFVSNLEPKNLKRNTDTTSLNGDFMEHQVVIYGFTTGIVTPTDLHASLPSQITAPDATKPFSLANPVDIVFDADGARAFVTALGPARIGVLNGLTARVEGRVDVGRGPRAMVIDNANQRLYVINRTDHSVMKLDTTPHIPVVIDTFHLFNPEPADVKDGRDFLYSTDFSFDGQSSCALCHIDAHLDHLGWDLGNPHAETLLPSPPFINGAPPANLNHPSKGTMVTQSLKGLRNHNPFHWRGDKPQFTDFNEAFANLLGGTELASEDMQAYDRFVKTIEYGPNYYFKRTNELKEPRALDGAVVFVNNCDACHNLTHDGAARIFDFDADEGMPLGGLLAQIQLVTQLRGINQKFDSDLYTGFGLIHDGRERREDNNHPLQTFAMQFFPNINAQGREDLIDFMTAFPTNVTNVVGWQVPVAGPADTAAIADVDVMIQEAFAGKCDVVARGVIAGAQRGFTLNAAVDVDPPQWDADTGTAETVQSILAALETGEQVVFMAVPPGSGVRIGIDADLDGTLNGIDPLPFSTPDFDCNGVVNIFDLLNFLSLWFQGDQQADYNGERLVNIIDLLAFLADWFPASA